MSPSNCIEQVNCSADVRDTDTGGAGDMAAMCILVIPCATGDAIVEGLPVLLGGGEMAKPRLPQSLRPNRIGNLHWL
jgi:hypothetical protein